MGMLECEGNFVLQKGKCSVSVSWLAAALLITMLRAGT